VGVSWEEYAKTKEYKMAKKNGVDVCWIDPPWLILKNKVTCCVLADLLLSVVKILFD
jgi:hypothetical protein